MQFEGEVVPELLPQRDEEFETDDLWSGDDKVQERRQQEALEKEQQEEQEMERMNSFERNTPQVIVSSCTYFYVVVIVVFRILNSRFLSIVQGGPGFPCFLPAMYKYIQIK